MLEVNIKLDYNDLKLLKAMTKLGDNTKIKSNIRLTKKGGKRLNKTKKIKKN